MKNFKVLTILCICGFLAVSPASFIISDIDTVYASESEEELSAQELKEMKLVDKAIDKLLKNKKFVNGSLKVRKKLAKKLLKKLKSKGLIASYDYNGDGTFGFQYKCGILGGIMLKKFDTYLN